MKKFFLLAGVCLFSVVGAFAQTTLRSGSIVTLKFSENVTSKSTNASVVVANDVRVGDQIVISAGTPVMSQVNATKRRGCGRAGSVSVNFISTKAVDGSIVNLMGGNITREGRNKKGMAIGLGVGLGVFVWPCLACLAIKGGHAVISEGTLTQNVFTANDVVLK